jgi:hypothetical protein
MTMSSWMVILMAYSGVKLKNYRDKETPCFKIFAHVI